MMALLAALLLLPTITMTGADPPMSFSGGPMPGGPSPGGHNSGGHITEGSSSGPSSGGTTSTVPSSSCQQVQLTTVYSTTIIRLPQLEQPNPGVAHDTPYSCWVINTEGMGKIADESYVVKLVVKSFRRDSFIPAGNSESGLGDCQSPVLVYDGTTTDSTTQLAEWCQDYPLGAVFSTGRKMSILVPRSFSGFTTEASVAVLAGQGNLGHSFRPCTPLFVGSSNLTYSLTSPGYPNEYQNNQDLCWVIYLDTNKPETFDYKHFVMLSVEDLYMEDSAECAYDYVHVYDGCKLQTRKMGEFCGFKNQAPMISCKPYMFIRFHTDSAKTYRGWCVSFKAVTYDTHYCHLMDYDYGVIFGWVSLGSFISLVIFSVLYFCRSRDKPTCERMIKEHILLFATAPVPGRRPNAELKKSKSTDANTESKKPGSPIAGSSVNDTPYPGAVSVRLPNGETERHDSRASDFTIADLEELQRKFELRHELSDS